MTTTELKRLQRKAARVETAEAKLAAARGELTEAIRAAAAGGVSARAIGRALGRSHVAIGKQLRQ